MMKSKKRIVSMLTVLAMVLAMMPAMAFADAASETADVYVTISDGNGKLVIVQEKITTADIDGDGVLTINDALFAAHEAAYEGGAAAGYGYYVHDVYGLSVSKMWGASACGYYLNDGYVMTPATPVKSGDRVKAWVYADTDGYSDKYAYFDKSSVATETGKAVELTLYATTGQYDENWMPLFAPVENAEITGAEGPLKTDAEGKVVLEFDEAGEYVISASSAGITMVPPVCVVTVAAAEEENISGETVPGVSDDDTMAPENDGTDVDEYTESAEDSNDDAEDNDESDVSEGDASPQTGDNFNLALYGVTALAALIAAAFCLRRKTCK